MINLSSPKSKTLLIKRYQLREWKCKPQLGKTIHNYKSLTKDFHLKYIKNSYNNNQDNSIFLMAKQLDRHFPKEDIQMTNKQLEKCFMLFVVREMQIKTIMRYKYKSFKKVKLKRWTTSNVGMDVYCWQHCKIGQPLGKMVWQFLIRVNIYLPAIPLLGIYIRLLRKRLCTRISWMQLYS